MVMAEPEPVVLLMVSSPVRPSREVTPLLPPPPPVHVPKLSAPEPLVSKQSPLIPSAVGKVSVKGAPVAPLCSVRVLLLVAFFNRMAPVLVVAVPRVSEEAPWTVSAPLKLTFVPSSVMVLLPIALEPVNLATRFVVPEPLIPLPPAQLARVKRQKVSGAPAVFGTDTVALPVAWFGADMLSVNALLLF